MRIFCAICVACLTAIAGCSPMVCVVKIDSISDSKQYPYKSYYLFPGNKDVDVNDLLFREFSTYVDRLLVSKGYSKAENIHSSEVVIVMSYGISGPQVSYSSSTEYGYKDGGTSTVEVDSYGSGGYSHSSGTISKQPEWGVVGTEVHKEVVYTRYLKLVGIDSQKTKMDNKANPIWETTATSEGVGDDLRVVLPLLVAASDKYLGQNSGGKVTVFVSPYEDKVREIRGLPKATEIGSPPKAMH